MVENTRYTSAFLSENRFFWLQGNFGSSGCRVTLALFFCRVTVALLVAG